MVKFGFQGEFWNRLDEANLKLTLVSQFDQDLVEKNCCCKLIGYYCNSIIAIYHHPPIKLFWLILEISKWLVRILSDMDKSKRLSSHQSNDKLLCHNISGQTWHSNQSDFFSLINKIYIFIVFSLLLFTISRKDMFCLAFEDSDR